MADAPSHQHRDGRGRADASSFPRRRIRRSRKEDASPGDLGPLLTPTHFAEENVFFGSTEVVDGRAADITAPEGSYGRASLLPFLLGVLDVLHDLVEGSEVDELFLL